MSEFIILDVGHGNCALLRDGNQVAVVDAPTRSLLLDTLDELKIETVHSAIISHADKDHIAGILGLLTSEKIKVEQIFVNPDGQKKTKIWRDFLAAVSVAHRKGECKVSTSLSATEPGTIKVGDVSIEVVAPSPTLALTAVGGKTGDGRTVTANSLSAVLKVRHGESGGALLAGDLDDLGLDDAIAHDADLKARLLVFPHHGGLPGGDPDAFVSKLLEKVAPETVIFSNGRSRHDNPRQEIVAASLAAGCSVACTQLSERCCAKTIEGEATHLEDIRASGRLAGASCAGSMTIELQGGAKRAKAASALHSTFVESNVPTPMCRVAAGKG